MKSQRVLLVLTVLNLLLLVFNLAHVGQAATEGVAPVLRGRALQIVDDQGKIRASINVYPASKQKSGESYPETVLLRLITERGRPSVKISASEELSGVALVGSSGTRETYVQLQAKGTVSSLRLKNEDGREQIVTP